MLKNNKKEIISLVKNDFIPLEESKEGLLKGGFGSVITQTETSSARTANNCPCDGNNCPCANGGTCDVPGNNCACATTRPPETPTSPSTTSFNLLMETGLTF